MKINANPTKSFFITMLTRDISLDRAILDLIDNSVDAAHVIKNFTGLKVKINITEDLFQIEDNCGGISQDIAENYAFRFGRDPEDHRETPGSVGQFGVGMKRTLFKLGERFEVESSFRTENGSYEEFVINVDVQSWLHDKDRDWGFQLLKKNTSIKGGTKITVNQLHDSVREQFLINEFLVSLRKEIAEAHFQAIKKGLQITLNDEVITASEIKLKTSEQIKPICITRNIDGVTCKIFAGVADQDWNLGGWYIICNGRLVEFAEKTKKTLWDVGVMPKYHDRFAYFRGVVEFESEDSSKLPWTTTKTGVDVDNKVYRIANKYMMEAFKPIQIFLNDIVKEKEANSKDSQVETILQDAIKVSNSVDYSGLDKNEYFTRPSFDKPMVPQTHANVTYKVDKERGEIAMDISGANSYSELGRMTFEYYFNNECK